MNKRFWIICSVICMGLLVLSGLGLSSLGMYKKGLAADRQREFMDVAKRIGFDVKQKVDGFLQTEQARPYTEYQMYFVPENGNRSNAITLVQSPLVNNFNNDLATGYFQLESDGRLTSPHNAAPWNEASDELRMRSQYFANVRQNLLPSLESGQTIATHRIEPTEREEPDGYAIDTFVLSRYRRTTTRSYTSTEPTQIAANSTTEVAEIKAEQTPTQLQETLKKNQNLPKSKTASSNSNPRSAVYPISNLKESQQATQVIMQSRTNFVDNTAIVGNGTIDEQQQYIPNNEQQESNQPQQVDRTAQQSEPQVVDTRPYTYFNENGNEIKDLKSLTAGLGLANPGQLLWPRQGDMVQVRIEPFVSMTVSDANGSNGIFAGQIYLLRHVQIEDRHLVQGFQLNEDALLTQIADSARQLLHRGMGYEISKTERPDAAFAAILQFDFGEVVLNLLEREPGLILARVQLIRNWFYGILGVVWLSVLIAMVALWKNLHEQVLLSRQKDDFISAVSHELRTPLTSIRMYTEMLEKNWVKTDDKRREYYTTMRTESERLTRLIENVLDFSRIQRGKKRYDFTLGDVNGCIGEVADMMQPHIQRAGFTLERQFETLSEFAFDRDAVVQIVINLIDNALKYAKDAEDKHIIIRTRQQKNYVMIEVEDRGPGIPRGRQKKIFDAFYRCEDESTRQNVGTGLGLALVKRFAEAHHGFVEIAPAKPTGALFRIGLAR